MQPAPPVAAPMVVSTRQIPQRKEHYRSECVLGLSVTHVIIGVLCILLQVVLICTYSPLHTIGQGIWTGLLFVLTGSFGIVASKKKTSCFIVVFLVLAIISAMITIGIITISWLEIFMEADNDYANRVSSNRLVGINVVMTILAVLQAVVAIISSAFNCNSLYGGNPNQPMMMAGQVHYIQGQDGQQQVVVLPFNQQGAGSSAGPSNNPVQAQLPAYDQTPPPMYESQTKLNQLPAYDQTPPPMYESQTKLPIPE